MNEELKQQELQRRLEQATAADPQTPLDPEAAAWREGWAAWGNLLETGNAPDNATVARLLDIPAASGMSPGNAEVRKTPAHSRRSWASYAGIASAALVVSLMVAVGMLKYAPSIDPPEDENTGNSIVNNKAFPFGRRNPLAWDDYFLDYRFARIETQLLLAQYDSPSLGYSFDSVRSNLDSLSKEIDQDL